MPQTPPHFPMPGQVAMRKWNRLSFFPLKEPFLSNPSTSTYFQSSWEWPELGQKLPAFLSPLGLFLLFVVRRRTWSDKKCSHRNFHYLHFLGKDNQVSLQRIPTQFSKLTDLGVGGKRSRKELWWVPSWPFRTETPRCPQNHFAIKSRPSPAPEKNVHFEDFLLICTGFLSHFVLWGGGAQNQILQTDILRDDLD